MMLVQQLVQLPEPPNLGSGLTPSLSPTLPTTTNSVSAGPTLPSISSLSSTSALQRSKTELEASKTSTTIPPKINEKSGFGLRPASLNDAAQIAHLGGSTFAETFGFSIPKVDLDAYLREAFTLEAISRDIGSATKHFVVVDGDDGETQQPRQQQQREAEVETDRQGADNKVLGFAQLTEGTSDACLTSYPPSDLVELQRLYVSPSTHGRGLGRSLMNTMFDKAREMGYRHIWLGVWEGNFAAQRFCERCGFERVGEHEFVMGRCVQIDWIMVKTL